MKNKQGYKIIVVDLDSGETMMDLHMDTLDYSHTNDIEQVIKAGCLHPVGLVSRGTELTIAATEKNKNYDKEYEEAFKGS